MMRKPKLTDFDLTEELLIQNKKEHALYCEKLNEYLKSRKRTKRIVLIVSLLISGLVLIINIADGFTTDCAGYSVGICFVWDLFYGLWLNQNPDETICDISATTCQKIANQTINPKIDDAVKKYTQAIKDYERKAHSINEHSLVKATLLLPFDVDLGVRWIVFSNIYLANPRSFPTLEIPDYYDEDFENYYKALTKKQESIVPRPKKHLNITEKMEFYYPCSDLFLAMKNKQANDIIELPIGASYKILQVINPDTE